MINLIAKVLGNTGGTQTSEFKLLAGYMPLVGIVLIALSIFLPPGRLTADQQNDLLIGGLALLGLGPAAYGVSRGVAKSGTADGPYDAEAVAPVPAPPSAPPMTTDTAAANKVAGV